MYILGIESSTKKLSIAISREKKLLYQVAENKKAGFMTRIIPMIDSGLKRAKLKIKDIDVFSVDRGPGDFTGTRIGISVAKGFSIAQDKAIFGIESLDIFSVGILQNSFSKIKSFLDNGHKVVLLPILDVKKDELFFSLYEVCSTGAKKDIAKISVESVDYFIGKLTENILIKSTKTIGHIKDIFLRQDSIPGNIFNKRDPVVFLGGTAFNSYRNLSYDMKKAGIDCILNKKSLYPHAHQLNFCTYFKILKKIVKIKKDNTGKDMIEKIRGDKSVLPLYIRDFIPFGNSKD